MHVKETALNRRHTVGRVFLLLMLAAVQSVCLAQQAGKLSHSERFRYYKERMMPAGDSSLLNNSGIIVLKETDRFVLFTGYDVFVDNLKGYIHEYNNGWDKDLLRQMQQQHGSLLLADKVATSPLARSRVDYRMADLLEQGNCLVYNKRSRKLEHNIVIKWYRAGTKCVTSGRLFYAGAIQICSMED